MMQRVYHITPQSEGLSKFGILSGTTVQVMLVKPDGSLFQCDAVGSPLKKESTLGEGWENPFRASLEEDSYWDPRDHPRDLGTGEFIDTASATRVHKRAATRAHQKRQKGVGKPKVEIPTKRVPVKTTGSKYDPQEPKAESPPAEKPKEAPQAPAAEEPKAPPAAEPKAPEAPPPAPTETPTAAPPAEQQPQAPAPEVAPPPPMQPPVPMAPEPQLPKEPKKGKELPQDTPYTPKEGPAPNLPVPPTSEPVRQPRLGEPPTIRPPVPAAPIMRRNPDLDAAFGFSDPNAPPPTPDQPPPAAEAPEAQSAQEVAQDPELSPLAQEMGVGDAENDPDVQALVDILLNMPRPQAAPAQPEQPGQEAPAAPEEKDTAEYLKARREQLSTASGRMSRKGYAKDLLKARKFVDSLPQNDPKFPKTPEERLALIREKAEEFQKKRADWWEMAILKTGVLLAAIGSVGAVTTDTVLDLSQAAVEEDPGEFQKLG